MAPEHRVTPRLPPPATALRLSRGPVGPFPRGLAEAGRARLSTPRVGSVEKGLPRPVSQAVSKHIKVPSSRRPPASAAAERFGPFV